MDLTALVYLIVALVVVGVCLYLLENFVPMDPTIKVVIRVIVVLVVVLYLLNVFGVIHGGPVLRR